MNFLIQPKKYKTLMADKGSRMIMQKTIEFFENMGKTRLLDDFNKKVWYREFVDFKGIAMLKGNGQCHGWHFGIELRRLCKNMRDEGR
jgi:hypothetical protein